MPLLLVEAETTRLMAVKTDAEFELLWEQQRHRFEHLWTGNKDGWLSNMGRYVRARHQVRNEMKLLEHDREQS